MAFRAGDRVRLLAREVTADDEKSGLYYSYFAGLTGAVDTIYSDGSVCVNVDLESLSEQARDRHMAMQEAERKKWLDGLSGEARSRLTPEQKQLTLSYKILASNKDLEPAKSGEPGGSERQPKARSSDTAPAADRGPARAPEPKRAREKDQPPPRRPSPEDLSKAEEEYLKSLKNKP